MYKVWSDKGSRRVKKLLASVIWFIFVGVGSICAQTETDILYKKHTFELGPEISYIAYKEPGVMKEKGVMYGVSGSYAYHNSIMLKVEGRGSLGRVDYSSPIFGEINNESYWSLEFRGLGGYDFPVLKASILTPFVGIGYRYLNDDGAGKFSTIGTPFYEGYSDYIYSPIGIGFITALGDNWFLGGTGEYDLFWWGEQKSHYNVAGLNDTENRQKNGFGLRGSITLGKKYKKVVFEGGPFIRYWNIKKSEIETLTRTGTPIGFAWEPKNNSTEVGIKLAIKY
jgi:hypothetical protein